VWGGKNRDVQVASPASRELAARWAEEVWSRRLGRRLFGDRVREGVLYTAFRRTPKSVVDRARRASGETLGVRSYENPFRNQYWQSGAGSYAMRKCSATRVLTASGTGIVFSLDKKTGKPFGRTISIQDSARRTWSSDTPVIRCCTRTR